MSCAIVLLKFEQDLGNRYGKILHAICYSINDIRSLIAGRTGKHGDPRGQSEGTVHTTSCATLRLLCTCVQSQVWRVLRWNAQL